MALGRGPFLTACLAVLAAYLFGVDLYRSITALGLFRRISNTPVNPEDLVTVHGTTHCEDLHYDPLSRKIFTACEGNNAERFVWFPPLTNFDHPVVGNAGRGFIHVIDTDVSRADTTNQRRGRQPVLMSRRQTKKAQKLKFENFAGLVSNHGIDVIPDPDRPKEAVYIFVVHHPPSPAYLEAARQSKGGKVRFDGQKEDPLVEIFHHVLGSTTAKHIRSVRHPLIVTPNDILARSPTSFYVSNDHHYAEGLLRNIEDVYFGATWSTTVHVHISDMSATGSYGIEATVALDGLHNNNGLGRGRTANEVFVTSCTSGTLHVGKLSDDPADTRIEILNAFAVDSSLDNPFFFSDPYANSTFDASGLVLAGVPNIYTVPRNTRDPTAKDTAIVWYVKPAGQGQTVKEHKQEPGAWEKRMLFQDDGTRIRTASTAVLIAIDPEREGGARKAWLYVTGFYAANVVAVKVDLE